MTRDERRFVEHVKDKKRRFLYLNHAIKGRYEVPGETLEPTTTFTLKHERKTLNPYNEKHAEQIKAGKGHWQEYPKTKYYGSAGYTRDKMLAKDIKEMEAHSYE